MHEALNFITRHSIVDESLEVVGLDNCSLFVEFDVDEIAFAVHAVSANRFLVFKTYRYTNLDELQLVFQTDEFLSYRNFEKTVISIVNNKATLIPNALYDVSKRAELLSFNHDIENNESVAVDDFQFFDAKNIYAIDDAFIQLINNFFLNPVIHHCSTPLIEGILLKNKNKNEIKVYANLHAQQLELAVVRGKQLLYSNIFNCQSAEDFIYYVMFMYEQLALNPEQVPLELSGRLTLNSSYQTITKKYVRFVELALRIRNKDFSYGFENLPAHQYQTLFDLSLCE